MIEDPQNNPTEEEQETAEEEEFEEEAEDQDVDEIEKELLDAMKSLRRKNKKVEEYLDGLARTVEKPQQEQVGAPDPEFEETPADQ